VERFDLSNEKAHEFAGKREICLPPARRLAGMERAATGIDAGEMRHHHLNTQHGFELVPWCQAMQQRQCEIGRLRVEWLVWIGVQDSDDLAE
jgi:hypothetical protein